MSVRKTASDLGWLNAVPKPTPDDLAAIDAHHSARARAVEILSHGELLGDEALQAQGRKLLADLPPLPDLSPRKDATPPVEAALSGAITAAEFHDLLLTGRSGLNGAELDFVAGDQNRLRILLLARRLQQEPDELLQELFTHDDPILVAARSNGQAAELAQWLVANSALTGDDQAIHALESAE